MFDITLPPSESNRIPVPAYREAGLFTGDYTYHRILSCTNHPEYVFSSKNPYYRSIFPVGAQSCSCPVSDLTVIGDDPNS